MRAGSRGARRPRGARLAAALRRSAPGAARPRARRPWPAEDHSLDERRRDVAHDSQRHGRGRFGARAADAGEHGHWLAAARARADLEGLGRPAGRAGWPHWAGHLLAAVGRGGASSSAGGGDAGDRAGRFRGAAVATARRGRAGRVSLARRAFARGGAPGADAARAARGPRARRWSFLGSAHRAWPVHRASACPPTAGPAPARRGRARRAPRGIDCRGAALRARPLPRGKPRTPRPARPAQRAHAI